MYTNTMLEARGEKKSKISDEFFCFLDRAFFNDEENNQQNALINSSINKLIEELISAYCWLFSSSLSDECLAS
jgi:hypothetical protein